METTQKYIHQFIPIFHCFSEMAVGENVEDFERIFERVCHCFCNVFTMTEDAVVIREDLECKKGKGDISRLSWEGYVLMMRALNRAIFDGYLHKR